MLHEVINEWATINLLYIIEIALNCYLKKTSRFTDAVIFDFAFMYGVHMAYRAFDTPVADQPSEVPVYQTNQDGNATNSVSDFVENEIIGTYLEKNVESRDGM